MAYLTKEEIAKTAVVSLENNLVMASLINRQYDTSFHKGTGSTAIVPIRSTYEATAFSTTVAAQSSNESSVAVILNHFMDVSIEITSQELSLDIVSFKEQVMDPIMRAQAQAMDYNIFNDVYKTVAGHYPVSSTPAIGDLTNVLAQLDIQKAPVTDRRGVLNPATYAKYSALDAILHADKSGRTLTFKENRIGRVLAADWYMDQNTPRQTSSIADYAGAFVGAATAGATAATVDALTDDEIIAAGDVFKVVGSDRGYLIVTGGTVATNAVTITFTPALDYGIADNAVVTFNGGKTTGFKKNLVFHKDAFTLATATLDPYLGGVTSSVQNWKGVSCRVAMGADMSSKKNMLSVDCLYGVKTINKELAAALID